MTSPIAAIAASVRAKKVSAVEVAEEAIRRVSAANPTLNFLSDEYFDDGRKDASTVPMGPLAGVPLLVKDLEDRQGWPTRKGSLLYKDAKPATENSPSVQRLLDAGCIAIGKSTLPEFAIEGFTANRQSGITRNPWNVDYSPGGSSGGSAAAVSAGAIGIGTATDGGGSVRIPASLCGLVGLKPTNGVIGRWPAHDWIDCSTDGVFTTTVEDLELVMSVQAGPSAGDPRSHASNSSWRRCAASLQRRRMETATSRQNSRDARPSSRVPHPAAFRGVLGQRIARPCSLDRA